jgi:glycine/D-amino acid oxidase-like deaminating enzyme
MQKDFKFDIAIVGAGITGITIARELVSKDPHTKIIILEQTLVGTGASRYSAGLHVPYGYNSKVQALTEVSGAYYATLIKEKDIPIFPIRFFGLVSKEKYIEIYPKFTQKIIVYPFNYGLGSNRIEQIGIRNNKTMFSISDAHYANVLDLIHYYIKDKEFQQKVTIWESINITDIKSTQEDVNIFLQNGKSIIASKAILALGPWVNKGIFNSILSFLKIRIKKVVALHIEQPPKINDAGIFFFDEDAFLLPLHQLGYWLFSYTCQEWDVSPDVSELAITSEDYDVALGILNKYYPSLVGKANSGRVFCDAYSLDKVPIVTSIPQHPRIIFAGASNGSGYRLAPGMAQLASSMVL